MKASAHAEVAPKSSKTTPRSQVNRESANAEMTSDVDRTKCRFGSNGSSRNQYSFITSLHTKASSGSVVSIFSPKKSRAMFTIRLSLGKLFSTLPSVLSPNVKYPESAMTRHATNEMPVL